MKERPERNIQGRKRPVELVYYEGYATKEEAMRREYAIKQLTRKEKLKLMEFWTETSAD